MFSTGRSPLDAIHVTIGATRARQVDSAVNRIRAGMPEALLPNPDWVQLTRMSTRGELMGIRELANRLGLPLSTLHYWQRRGLIGAHCRGGQRYYDHDQAHRIALIQIWRATDELGRNRRRATWMYRVR